MTLSERVTIMLDSTLSPVVYGIRFDPAEVRRAVV